MNTGFSLMILMRLAGVILVFAATFLLRCKMVRSFRRRVELLHELLNLIGTMERETVHHRLPLADAFEQYAAHSRTELKNVLRMAAEEVRKRDGSTFGELWNRCVEEALPEGVLSPDEKELLTRAGETFCQSDPVLQTTLLAQYGERLRRICEMAEKECREKTMLCSRLLPAAAIFLILLLL